MNSLEQASYTESTSNKAVCIMQQDMMQMQV